MNAEAVLSGDVGALDAIVDAFYGHDATQVRDSDDDAMRGDAMRWDGCDRATKRPNEHVLGWMRDVSCVWCVVRVDGVGVAWAWRGMCVCVCSCDGCGWCGWWWFDARAKRGEGKISRRARFARDS